MKQVLLSAMTLAATLTGLAPVATHGQLVGKIKVKVGVQAGRAHRTNAAPTGGNQTRPRRAQDRYLYQALHRRYVGRNLLQLRQLLNIGPQFNGARIRYVVLRAETDAGQGQARLLVNGRANSLAQTVGRVVRDYTFIPTYGTGELGRDIQSLQIELQGQFNAVGVGVMLDTDRYDGGGGGWAREVIQIPIRRLLRGQTNLSLEDLLRRQGRIGAGQVLSVTLVASTAAGQGRASLCSAYSCSSARVVSSYRSRTTFQAHEAGAARDARDLRLALQGNFDVDLVEIVMMRR